MTTITSKATKQPAAKKLAPKRKVLRRSKAQTSVSRPTSRAIAPTGPTPRPAIGEHGTAKKRVRLKRAHFRGGARPTPGWPLSWQIEADDDISQSVYHAGRVVAVQVVSNTGGYYREGADFTDALCRAADGSAYYLARITRRDPMARSTAELAKMPTAFFRRRRARVKRLSVRGALTYVLGNSARRITRHDLDALLTTGALDAQARAAVVQYASLTGSHPRDVLNGGVTGELARVVKMLTGERCEDDGLGVMADHVAAAGRRRRGQEAVDAPVILTDLQEEDHIPRPLPEVQTALVGLGPEAQDALETLKREFPGVNVDLFLRAAVEGDLLDAVEDLEVGGTIAAAANRIAEESSSTFMWRRHGAGVVPLKPASEAKKPPLARYEPLTAQAKREIPEGLLGQHPAVTFPVTITAEEHAEIAAFCEQENITVEQYVTLCGVGVSVSDYADDCLNREGLLDDIAERFGGKVTISPARTVTLEFSPEAFAMMEANRVADGFDSVEKFVRSSVRGTVGAFCESLDSGSEDLKDLFAAPGAE